MAIIIKRVRGNSSKFRKQVSISLSLFSQTQHIVNLSLSGHTWCMHMSAFFSYDSIGERERKKSNKMWNNFSQWSLIEPTHEEARYKPKLIMVRSKLTRHESAAAHLPSLNFTSTSPNSTRKCTRKAKNSRKDCRCEIFHVFLFSSTLNLDPHDPLGSHCCQVAEWTFKNNEIVFRSRVYHVWPSE